MKHNVSNSVLDRFRSALDEIYGSRLERVLLFGSRARGDARANSDYDVAVFIEGLGSIGIEAGKIAAGVPISCWRRASSSMPCRSKPAPTTNAPA